MKKISIQIVTALLLIIGLCSCRNTNIITGTSYGIISFTGEYEKAMLYLDDRAPIAITSDNNVSKIGEGTHRVKIEKNGVTVVLKTVYIVNDVTTEVHVP
ncbi:hypothetical protein GMST_33440 [Geomonas silvestris]|uniref:Lipoprotein n=1 Tax=Geomonas silvestris TaxID=2740184 RepID=A0A6V8MMY8_9BACT|nr:hypothetical protein [Geomonas silvestris]GFO61019.1 hypothetical protein GMST_33440 [Geomonas silvestris]